MAVVVMVLELVLPQLVGGQAASSSSCKAGRSRPRPSLCAGVQRQGVNDELWASAGVSNA